MHREKNIAMKPEHLSKAIGDQFSDKSIVENYGYRPEYSSDVIQFLSDSLTISEMDVLDIGTGTGEIAIPLSMLGHRVVGVDPSLEMIKAATLKHSKVKFVHSYIENFVPKSHFDLFVAANSIHWADWEKAFPVLKSVSKSHAKLAIVTGGDISLEGLQRELLDLIQSYSTTQNFKPYCVINMLDQGGFIKNVVATEMAAVTVEQNINDYIASFHARNGFSLERMGPYLAQEFDDQLRSLLAKKGFLENIRGQVTYKVTIADMV
ncbi:class I SAM-dependent methyltransferase [Reinekea forsetii]|nr:class I SAM-dependent methyltransferase [Reinekea forsetii]